MKPEQDQVRLNKLMADRGLCSRREADKFIEAGQVLINSKEVAQVGQKVFPDVSLEIQQAAQEKLKERFVVIMNKPIGVVSNLPEPGQQTASDLLSVDSFKGRSDPKELKNVMKYKDQLAVAGRLDRASRGLLVLSNDGRVIREITQSTWCKKTYLVTLFQQVESIQIKRLKEKRKLGRWNLLPMQVEEIAPRKLKFVLQEGKKHQIRDCCRSVGLTVKDLFRTQIGPIELKNLRKGEWRLLSSSEVQALLPQKGS